MRAVELDTVIAIPPIPFRGGKLSLDAHEKNVNFLIQNNFSSEGRRRAIALGGTSLVHHLSGDEMLQVVEITGRAAGREAVVIAGIVSTPTSSACELIESMTQMDRPPDYFLLMPLPGVQNPDGIRRDLGKFIDDSFKRFEGRFLVYLRDRTLLPTFQDMLQHHEGLVGIKIGTVEEDVSKAIRNVPGHKNVIWGVGDRATRAAQFGSQGHTSGITLICPRVCDGIQSAYAAGDYEEAFRLERLIEDFEDVRFMEGRAYNYSAVVSAARIAGFSDIDLGDGGPFNAEPPAEILQRLEAIVESLGEYHC